MRRPVRVQMKPTPTAFDPALLSFAGAVRA